MGAVVSALNNVGYSTQKSVVIKSWTLSACRPRFPSTADEMRKRNTQPRASFASLGPSVSPPLLVPARHAGLLYYSILAVVFAYVVGFTLVAKKGYQATVPAVGSVALKVKGIASRPSPPGSNALPELWDASDLTVYDATSVFVATNIMRTEQARGVCPGTHEDEACALPSGASGNRAEEAATECREGVVSRSGVQTGRCVPASLSAGAGACEVRGWCPGEPDEDALAPLDNVGNFTVFLRTDVRFPGMRDKFGRTFDVTNANGTEPTPGWNLFTLDDILRMGGTSYEDVRVGGADLQMNIYYDCDLDNALEACSPRMPFEVMRVDTADSSLSHGYNTRWLSAARSDEDAPGDGDGARRRRGADARALVKASGPRIRVSISGVGRRFDLGSLTTVVGAGVALMGVATAVVDVLLLYVLPKRAHYFGLKYQVYGAADEDLSCGAEAAREPEGDDAAEPLLAA